jgi:hypothetical protein
MAAAEKFNLEVTITGLCLHLPWPKSKKMHVLMADGHGTPHCPLIFYDKTSRPVKLKGMRLDLTDCKGSQSTVPDFDTMPELALVHEILLANGNKVDPLPDPDDPTAKKIPHVAGRVVLPPGSKEKFPDDPKGPWDAERPRGHVRKSGMRLAWYVVWHVTGIPGDRLPWKIAPLTGSGTSEKLPELHPDADGWIRLVISNLPPVDKPDCSNPDSKDNFGSRPPAGKAPDNGTPMHHFRDFYGLYGLDPNSGDLPDLVYRGPETGVGAGAAAGTAYNCATSGGH